jgi:hypothetical protein
MRTTKMALLAGISGLALQLAAPGAFAADMALKSKAPPLPTPAVWTWWIEGGGSYLSGDPFVPAFNSPPFDINAKRWGGQGAIGFDYKFASSLWHVSADFRYMENGTNTAGGPETGIFVATPAAVVGTNTANRKEHNWEADFMVGRDLQIGNPTQLKFGLRVADIWGQTNGVFSGIKFVPSGTQTRTYQQTNKFLGVGPRAAIEGSIPLQGAWSIEYNGGVAGLWDHSTANQTVGVSGMFGGGGVVCVSGCPIAVSSTSNNFIFNADGQVGLAYALSPSSKLSLDYRIDGYWNALRGFTAAGAGTNLNRVYSGPTLKLSVAY